MSSSQGGGGRGAWPRAPPSSFGARGRKTTGGEAAVGWAAGGAGPGGLRGERQVSFLSSLLLFLFNSVFYFLYKKFSQATFGPREDRVQVFHVWSGSYGESRRTHESTKGKHGENERENH